MKKRMIAWCLLLAMILAFMPTNVAEAATYQRNSSGNRVRNIQYNVSFLGYSVGTIDGHYGGNTEKAVKQLQFDLHMEQTGKVTEEFNSLIENVVRDIQSYLKEKGYYTGVIDGIAGNGTRNSLKNFQKVEGYTQTGIVNDLLLWDMVNDSTSKTEMNNLSYWVLCRRNGGCEYKNEEYLDLFRQYPFFLENETINNVLSNYIKIADDVLRKNEKGTIFGAILTGLMEGKDIIWNELVSIFSKNSKTYKEEMRLEAITCVMNEICKNDNLLTVVAEEVGNQLEVLESGYNWNDKKDREKLSNQLSGLYGNLSVSEVESIFELIDEDSTVSSGFKGIDVGMKIAEYAVEVIHLYQIETATIDRLLNVLPQDCGMYKDLEYLKKEKSRDEVAYIMGNFASGYVKDKILERLQDSLLPFPSNIIMTGAELSISIFANHIHTGALSEELIRTYFLKSYLNTLNVQRMQMITKYIKAYKENGPLPTIKEMEEYEFIYSAYLAAAKTYLVSAEKIADKYDSSLIDVALKEYDNLITYDNYIKLCLKKMETYRAEPEKELQKKMLFMLEEQLGAVPGKTVYFTKNQKGCYTSTSKWESKHYCIPNCNVSDIVQSKWFKDIFGVVNTNNFPEHDRDASYRDHAGQSCFGFACFAQWYLYADSVDEKVIGKRVTAVTFNKANIEKYAKPGDVIRVNGHSVLVYSLDENGIWVIDSNWNIGGQLNCAVQKHLITYNGTYAGYTAYINRVTKNSDVPGKYYGKVTSQSAAPIVTVSPTVTPTPTPTDTPTPTPEAAVSGWVKASDCPAGVTVVDTKWTYTYTERAEFTEASKAGWIQDGMRKEVVASGVFDYATFPDTFDKTNNIYQTMYTSKEAVPVTDGAVREILSDAWAGYVYWHYSYPVSGSGLGDRIVGYAMNTIVPVNGGIPATVFSAFKSVKDSVKKVKNGADQRDVYKMTELEGISYDTANSHWWYRFEYNTCTYQDVKTFYQYYQTTEKESTTEVYEGNGKSNVVKWVRYK